MRTVFATFLGTHPVRVSLNMRDHGDVEYARTDVHTRTAQVGVLLNHGNLFAIEGSSTL